MNWLTELANLRRNTRNQVIGSERPGFLGAIAHRQSYVNIAYLLLGLPLGIAYFVFLVTGISVGFGLLVIGVGFPILALVLAVSWAMCQFERVLAVGLLNEDIPPVARKDASGQEELVGSSLSFGERLFIGTWRRLKAHLTNRLTWTGMFYFFLRFPLGIGTFVMAVTLISVTFSPLGAPLYYWVDDGIDMSIWRVDVLWEALILTLADIAMVFISLSIMNATAFLSGRLARVILGKPKSRD